MGFRRWRKWELDLVREMLEDGTPTKQIARQLKRPTARSVCWAARLAGVRVKQGQPVDHERRMEVMNALSVGLTLTEAAKRVDVHVSTLRHYVRELVRDGFVKRTGGATHLCRYVVVRHKGNKRIVQ